MPVTLAGWYLLRSLSGRAGEIYLTIMSMIFYGMFSLQFLAILSAGAVVTYLAVMAAGGIRTGDPAGEKTLIRSIRPRAALAGGIIVQLALLFAFKYYGFFSENLNRLTGIPLPVSTLVMPVGLSFYTFGQIGFLVDIYRGDMIIPSFLEYLCCVMYFPKILQGPIAGYGQIIEQFRNASKGSPAADDVSSVPSVSVFMKRGLILFTIGLSKKVLLGDTFAGVVDYGFMYSYGLDTLTAVLVILSYAFQLYFDFSGYCDMAEGVSLMLGIELPRNFNSPYKSASSRQLWQRWHMTLSNFFIRYVYIPLGGSRKGRIRTLVNVMIVFVLSGLWHGAGWTYICWGVMQGLLVVSDDIRMAYLDKTKDKKSPPKKSGNKLSVAMTFIMFTVSLVFFRSADMAEAGRFFRGFVNPRFPGLLLLTARNLNPAESYILLKAASSLGSSAISDIVYLITWAVLLMISAIVIHGSNAHELADRLCEDNSCTVKWAPVCLGILFAVSFLSLGGVSTFLYFKY